MASLSLQHINKTYPNGFQAVKDFNLEIEDKEFIIFVGPSGCGKSTTLRMVAGLEEISGGTLKIGDKVMNDVEPKDRDIAMVFQNYALIFFADYESLWICKCISLRGTDFTKCIGCTFHQLTFKDMRCAVRFPMSDQPARAVTEFQNRSL